MSEPTTGASASRPDGGHGTADAPTVPGPPGPPPTGERRRRNVGWRSRDVLRTVALVVGFYVLLKLLWFANDLVLVAFLGVLFGLAISAGVDRLERVHVPRGAGAAFIVLSFLAAVYGVGALMAPTISEQSRELKTKLPEAVDRVEGWMQGPHGGVFRLLAGTGAPPDTGAAAPSAPSSGTPSRADSTKKAATDSTPKAPASPLREGLSRQLRNASHYLFPFLTSTLTVLGGLAVILFVAIYTAADPDLYHRGIMHLFPHRSRPLAGKILSEMASVMRKWLVTQLIAMLVIGSVTTVVLLFMHVKAAFVLGIIAGVLEFVPTVGPILSAVPAIAMGFLDSPEKALYVAIAYIVIQQLENHILIPLLMKGGMDLPPVLTILTQALMALVFGFLGLMVAVPMLAAALVPIKMLYVERVVGDDVEVEDADDDDG
ncbi:MAG TPA: AI-2E family transporter [Gemmatimonadaceae bacterium]|nr:AI-2E family transporter [Gemmatimonadaceae bacterium]